MSKRIFSLILAAVMVFSLLPVFASAAGEDATQVAEAKSYSDPGWTKSGGMATRKTLTPDENGNYTITMEAYAEGETVTQHLEYGFPLDIAIVVDQSGSMAYGTQLTEQYASNNSREWYYDNLPEGQAVYYKDATGYHEVKPGIRSSNYYGLYYEDGNGNTQWLRNGTYNDGYDYYSGKLYVTSGTPRYQMLQAAATKFCETVAAKANELGVDHKIAFVGFAGNQHVDQHNAIPTEGAVDKDIYHYSGYNRYWDYVNTGVFVGNQFYNYKTIDRFIAHSGTDTSYTNLHYFLDNEGKTAAYYDEDDGFWRNAITDDQLSPSSDLGRTTNNRNRTFYEPVYDNLKPEQYQAALVSAYDENTANHVNSNLTQSVETFGCLGGTYTSYGIAMANQVFANDTGMRPDTTGTPVKPMKVIIVFTDGQPGGSGFEDAIANEALADAAIFKQTYTQANGDVADGQIYTLGLFASAPTAGSKIYNFMYDLSSNSNASTSNVYRDAVNSVSSPQTYYYTDPAEKKTYSVTRESNLGYFTVSFNQSNGMNAFTRATRNGAYLYDINGSSVNSPSRGNAYIFSSNGYWSGPYMYDYLWVDSNGLIRMPYNPNSGKYTNTTYQGYSAVANDCVYDQFFSVSTNRGEDGGFYATVQDAEALATRFDAIASDITVNTASTSLGAEDSYLLDVISDQFDLPENFNASQILLQTDVGTADSTGKVTFDETPVNASDVTASQDPDNKNRIIVEGFDYSGNYISFGKTASDGLQDNQGRKLIVTISGLIPNESGTISSNTDDSGIYKKEADNADSNVAPFTNPYITIDDEYKVLDFSAKSLLTEFAHNYNEKSVDEHGGSFAYESTAHKLFFTPAFAFNAEGKANISAFSETSSALYFSKAVDPAWKKVNVVPANNVYFDDDLTAQQNTLSRGDNGYGYLSDSLTNVNQVTNVKKTDAVNTREITFHGKRLDVYFQSDQTVNNVSVTLKDAQGDAAMGTINGNANASRLDSVIVHKTEDQTMVNVPVISAVFDEVNTYTVVLSAKTANGFRIDGVRVYGAADETDETVSTAYTADGELNADFTRVRELLLSAASFNSITESSPVSGAVFVDLAEGTPTIADYTKDGPKNEVYLSAGQGVAFNVEGYENKKISVGLRSAESDAPASAEVSNGAGTNTYPSIKSIDMYYSVTPDASGNVYIKNTSGGILAVTNIKVTDAAQTIGGESKKVEFFATARTMSYVRSFDELENVTVEPSPEPTQQPSIVDLIHQLLSAFVTRLFSSIGRLFGN